VSESGIVSGDHSQPAGSDDLVVGDAHDLEVSAELARTAFANQVAVLLIQYRVEHGLTQTALSRQLGVRQRVVARLEAGDREPPVAMLARLANRLGITLRLLVAPDSVQLVRLP
jgi:ribosome-binding protein aMBF1 (putative translation factor)